MCKLSPFLFDRIQIIPVLRKRMEALVFFITVQNHGIAAVYKHNPNLFPDRLHIVNKIIKIGKIVSLRTSVTSAVFLLVNSLRRYISPNFGKSFRGMLSMQK